jgi:hypothetical protein
MNRYTIIGVIGIVLILILTVLLMRHNTAEAPVVGTHDDAADAPATTTEPLTTTTPIEVPGSKPVVPQKPTSPTTFSGVLSEVNTGCFADGECYAVVGGKHVTLTVGRRQEVLGSIKGAPSIGDLEAYIGEQATVYAKRLPDGTYTLYGDESFYLSVPPKVSKGCVVSGCSSQLCVEEGNDMATTCEWTAKYSCYQQATCERQTSGQCGWTETPTLLQCLREADTAPIE